MLIVCSMEKFYLLLSKLLALQKQQGRDCKKFRCHDMLDYLPSLENARIVHQTKGKVNLDVPTTNSGVNLMSMFVQRIPWPFLMLICQEMHLGFSREI